MKKADISKDFVEKKVTEYCRSQGLFDMGDKVVLGVSGGADSVCLLFLLHRFSAEFGLKLSVVHVNHGVRPEAGEDEAYVQSLCRELGLPCHVVRADVPALAAGWKCSTEEAGRILRYRTFEEYRAAEGAQKIAVAHNENDRAETFLFHLFRGSGLTGLGSIRPKRDLVVRPLLCLERWEIEAYLDLCGIRYCQDATNEGDEYTRNRIRHHILPEACSQVSEGAIGNLCRAADILSETEDYMKEQVLLARESCVRQLPEGSRVDAAMFEKLHPALQNRLLLELIKELTPEQKDITAAHVQQVRSLLLNTGNREYHLPYGILAQRRYEKVVLSRAEDFVKKGKCGSVPKPFSYEVDPEALTGEPFEVILKEGGKFIFRVLGREDFQEIGRNQYTKRLDYDKIKGLMEIRPRQTGDYLCVDGSEDLSLLHQKTIKKYMIDEKIPRQERDSLPLLAAEHHILWVTGYRISAYYKISPETVRVLEITYVPA